MRAVAAYNTSKRDPEGRAFHPREAGWVGYDLNVRGERLYHSGDTDVIPEMDAVTGVDVALLPVSGTYVMTAGEAAEAARRIQPRVAVPMHWGHHIGTRADADAVRGPRAGRGADPRARCLGGYVPTLRAELARSTPSGLGCGRGRRRCAAAAPPAAAPARRW